MAPETGMASDELLARDAVIRQAAFDHVRGLQSRDLVLTHEAIAEGFLFEGNRWPLVNPQRGIFKPRQMPFLLSIRTVFPRQGARVWYDDQVNVHRQIFAGDEELDYAFMGSNPAAPENQWLREAAERQIPLIYFLGVSPGRYQAIIPDRAAVVIGGQHTLAESNLPHDHLLDAAHIMADADELFGQPVVPNGIALSKVHHAAFDNHLIGIDPDGHVHVSERLPRLHDGPLLEQSLKAAAGALIRLPRSMHHHPNRDRLAARYEQFKRVA